MSALSIKINQVLLFFILFVIVLHYGRPILVPVIFAAFLSILMSPLIDFLDRRGFRRVFSTISYNDISGHHCDDNFDLIGTNYQYSERAATEWGPGKWPYSMAACLRRKLIWFPDRSAGKVLKGAIDGCRQFIGFVSDGGINGRYGIASAGNCYACGDFPLLFNKEKYHGIFMAIMDRTRGEKHEILNRVTNVAQQYLKGRMISIFILFVLYYLALLIIFVSHDKNFRIIDLFFSSMSALSN